MDLGEGTGCVLVDIFCFRDNDVKAMAKSQRLYLLLQTDPTFNEYVEGHMLYTCRLLKGDLIHGLVKSKHASRLVNIALQTIPEAPNIVEWRSIYISPRPSRLHSRRKLDPDHLVSRLTLGPSPPFRIKTSTISSLSHHGIRLTSVTLTPTPWTGYPPAKFVFGTTSGKALSVTLGMCRAYEGAIGTANPPGIRSPHYAVVTGKFSARDDEASAECSAGTESHNCATDHVWHGSVINTWLHRPGTRIKISFVRSLVDIREEILEVHMEAEVS